MLRHSSLKVATKLEAGHAREIVEQAYACFGVPEIINTDQGSQFTAEEFTRTVLDKGCKLLMNGRRGLARQCVRRAPLAQGQVRARLSAARTEIQDYMDGYNTARPHSRLNRKTPIQAYSNALLRVKQAA